MAASEKIGQEQFHSFVFGESLSWQDIIYDLINSEQLDPWDIDLLLLSQKYLERVRELEEANFMLSSKVLMVCSILLRIKSEILINHYIKDLDDILFNKPKDEEKISIKDLEFENEEIPILLPRTPLPRFKKVSLNELMAALNKAIITETRRVVKKEREKEMYEKVHFFMPKKTQSLAQRIKEIHERIKNIFQSQESISFSDFAGFERNNRINHFVPLLHLDTQNKLWLEQEKHLDEIWILKQRIKKLEDEMNLEGNEIITDNIERSFEKTLENNEQGWEMPEKD